MKKIFFIAGSLLFFGLAPAVFAQGFVPLAPIPGLTQGVTADSVGLATFFNNLYKFLIGIAAVLAVIEIIWGGLEISTQDSVSKNKDGKDRIWQAILGLVLVLSPVIVFSIINPSILNLSLNLPPLDTKSGQSPARFSPVGTATPCVSSSSTSDTACVQKLQDECRAAGGTPKLVGVGVISVQCDGKINAPALGTTITVNQCADLRPSNPTRDSLQPSILPASTVANCTNAIGALSPAAQGYNSCADITGGGVCFYNK